MLRADQVELAILNLLVDWSDAGGRTFGRPLLESMLTPQIGAVSDREIVEALIILAENKLVFIDQYRGSQFVPTIPMKALRFSTGRTFGVEHCREPGADNKNWLEEIDTVSSLATSATSDPSRSDSTAIGRGLGG